MDPHLLASLPDKVKLGVRKSMQLLGNDHITKYKKSQVDPFHPDVPGARVPSQFATESATYKSEDSFQVSGGT